MEGSSAASVCVCGHPAETHETTERELCRGTVYTDAPLGGGGAIPCPCAGYEPRRKYALVKVVRGDYVLPSNDGATLWRLTEYAEDGSAEFSVDGKTWKPLIGTFWQLSMFARPIPTSGVLADDWLDWGYWSEMECNLPTRKAAIEAAMRRDARA